MMDMKSIIDATVTFLAVVAVLTMGIGTFSSTSITVSTTSGHALFALDMRQGGLLESRQQGSQIAL